jgi:hypothetical protein
VNDLFPLFIFNETIKSVKNGRTTIKYNPESFSALDDPNSEIVDKILQKYNFDSDELLWKIDSSVRVQNFRPWLIILYEKEYKLGGYISSIRKNRTDILFSAYSIPDDYSLEKHGVPLMSFICIKNKSIFKTLSSQSTLFSPMWKYLKDASEKVYWVFISQPPNNKWYNKAKVHDEDLYMKSITL